VTGSRNKSKSTSFWPTVKLFQRLK